MKTDLEDFKIKPLSAKTWSDFARLIEENNGVWGGCWCMWYHGKEKTSDGDGPEDKRRAKEALVSKGQAHASLVYDGDDCVGWCQFGPPKELPRLHNLRAYLSIDPALPDWRITCIFSGKDHRQRGVAAAALEGALEQIKRLGGGLVEGYPENTEDRNASSAFLFNGTLKMFERQGFEPIRKIGKHKWVVSKTIS